MLGMLAGTTLARASEPARSDGSDIGVTIVGAIVQNNSAANVALIKDSTGSVQAVKQDFVILDKYKVIAVHPKYLDLIDRAGKRYQVYEDKFASQMASQKAAAERPHTGGDQYREDGFERVKGRISMTSLYRDNLVKHDLAHVLMQATAEPAVENGQIIGFKIFQIDDGSIFAKAGLVNGDIITNINGQDLTSVAGAVQLLQTLKNADHIDVDVRRGGTIQHMSIDVR